MRQLLALALLGLASFRIDAAPCTTAGPDCTEWVKLPGRPAGTLIYRSYALDTPNQAITRAVVIVHGSGRDADNIYRSVLAAAFLGDALNDTLIISPRFASNDGRTCRDTLAPNEVNWTCNGPDRWSYGGPGKDTGTGTSFDLIDEILRKIARKEIFPNLKAIVVTGHSAGGMFVTRYEMTNVIHEKLGLPISYVVSNPSSYVYFQPTRPTSLAYPVTAAPPGYMPAPPTQAFLPFSDARNCPSYDLWPYGMHNRTGYSARLPDDVMKKQLAARPTTYLLGQLDILPLGGMDLSCSAMAQGPTRLARGLAFVRYANETLGAHHQTVIVPLCGHNSRCMYTAEVALPLIFPKATDHQ